MTTQAQLLGLGEFTRWEFTLEHPNDHILELCHQGEFITRFRDLQGIEQRLQAECARHLVTKHGWDGCLWSRKELNGNSR